MPDRGLVARAQVRAGGGQFTLEEAMALNTDIAGTWANYMTIQATRRDIDGMQRTFGRLPAQLKTSLGLYRWWYPSIYAAARNGDFEFAEILCRTARDEEKARGTRAGSFAAAGELGQIYEQQRRMDDALTEWSRAFDEGSTDTTTANRLSMNLDRLKRYDEATAVIEAALERGLPAATEETLRKRLERITHRASPKTPRKVIAAFSVRSGDGYAEPIAQVRMKPPVYELIGNGETVTSVAATKGIMTLTRLTSRSGEHLQRTDLPVLSDLQMAPDGWGIGVTRAARVGEGPAQLSFLSPDHLVRATFEIPDAVSEIAYSAGRWYVGCRAGGLYAFETTGALSW